MSPIKKKDRPKFAPPLHKINMIPRRPMSSRYQQIFLGHCYYCKYFGHKSLNCKANGKLLSYEKNAPSNNTKERNLNSLLPLQRYDIECYKCNNHGNGAIECKLMTPTKKCIATKFQDRKLRKD